MELSEYANRVVSDWDKKGYKSKFIKEFIYPSDDRKGYKYDLFITLTKGYLVSQLHYGRTTYYGEHSYSPYKLIQDGGSPSITELRTICNKIGESCRDANGKLLNKASLLKRIQQKN